MGGQEARGEEMHRVIKTSTVGPEKQQKSRRWGKEQMGVDYLRILPPSLSAHSDSSVAIPLGSLIEAADL